MVCVMLSDVATPLAHPCSTFTLSSLHAFAREPMNCHPQPTKSDLHKSIMQASDDSDAMDVQVEMDHRYLSLVHHGHGTATVKKEKLGGQTKANFYLTVSLT